MRHALLALMALLVLTGCAKSRRVPAPAPVRPAPASVPPATTPAPSAPASTPAPPLTPQISTEQERQLLESTQQTIGATDRLLQQIEKRVAGSQQRETFVTAQSFLDQARRALVAREYQRAANLASKARVLTDDLAAKLR